MASRSTTATARGLGSRLLSVLKSPRVRKEIEPFVSEGGRDPWVRGGCYVLARALASVLDAPVVGLVHPGGRLQEHFVVRVGQDYLDGQGLWPITELQKRYPGAVEQPVDHNRVGATWNKNAKIAMNDLIDVLEEEGFGEAEVSSATRPGAVAGSTLSAAHTNKFNFEPGRTYSFDELPKQVQRDVEQQFDDPDEIADFDFKARLMSPAEIADATFDGSDYFIMYFSSWAGNKSGLEEISDLDDPQKLAAFMRDNPRFTRVLKSIKTRGADYPSVGSEGVHRLVAHYVLKKPAPYLELVMKDEAKVSAAKPGGQGNKLTDVQRLAALSEAELDGFGGNCGEVAIAINDILFDGKGKLVAAVNSYLWHKKKRLVGHVGVKVKRSIWDAEGTYDGKAGEEEFLSWGQLDPEDSDYEFEDDDQAFDAEVIELTEDQVRDNLPFCGSVNPHNLLRTALEHVVGKKVKAANNPLFEKWRKRGENIEVTEEGVGIDCPSCGIEMQRTRGPAIVCPECGYQEERATPHQYVKSSATSPVLSTYTHYDGELGTGEEIVITLNDEPIGHLSLFYDKDSLNEYAASMGIYFDGLPNGQIGYLGGIELPELLRGKGLGKQAFDLLVSEARDGGAAAIALISEPQATPFWLKMGFQNQQPKSRMPPMVLSLRSGGIAAGIIPYLELVMKDEAKVSSATRPRPIDPVRLRQRRRGQGIERVSDYEAGFPCPNCGGEMYKAFQMGDEKKQKRAVCIDCDYQEVRGSVVEAMAFRKPYDGWKDLRPGKLEMPIELEGSPILWASVAERIGHNPASGLQQRAPVIGGRRRYHHRPLRSYHLSNDRTLTITTDQLEANVWNSLKNKRHPSMPRVYDVFSLKKLGESKAALWAIVHEPLVWPVDRDWELFVDTFFRWRAMAKNALSPARDTDLEDFLRFIIDPESSDPETVKRQRVEEVLPWKTIRTRRDDVSFRRKKLFAVKGLEDMIRWAKSAIQYLKANKVRFRDFDPSNLAMTKKDRRVVITNLAESRSRPQRTGRTGRVQGSTASEQSSS